MVKLLLLIITLSTFGLAQQPRPTRFANCGELNRVYPNGVGRANAKDKTSRRPVTTFLRNTALYDAIVRNNANLDRDNDGIACEKR